MKMKKRWLGLGLCAALLCATVLTSMAQDPAEEEQAPIVYDSAYDVSGQRETMEAPKKEGYVFAGWYQEDATDESGYAPLKKAEADAAESAVAKFVSENVLSVKCQITAETEATSECTNLRIMTSVDDFQYSEVGFTIALKGKTASVKSDKVYSTIHAYTKEDGVTPYTAKETFGCDASAYFMSFLITEVSGTLFQEQFTVTPYWMTKDGTRVDGVTKEFTIYEAIGGGLHMAAEADALVGEDTTLTLNSSISIPETAVTWESSNAEVATVANGVVTPLTHGEVTISATYKGVIASCEMTVYDVYIDSDEDWNGMRSNLSGWYKVTQDLNVTADDCVWVGKDFTGLLDLGGHTITLERNQRIFQNVDGGTIRNGHLVTSTLGVWGAAIADVAKNAITEDITLDVTIGQTRNYYRNDSYNERNAGGLYNTITGGRITSCTVTVTLPSNLTVTSGFGVVDISALGGAGAEHTNISDCSAALINQYNTDGIQLSKGHSANETVSPFTMSLSDAAETELATPITLDLNTSVTIPDEWITWESSNEEVAVVADGVVTPLTSGEVTISATYKGVKASCVVTIYDAYIDSTEDWALTKTNTSGWYKVTENITVDSSNTSHWSGKEFKGLLDFGGHTITVTGSHRLFHKIDGGTIRNGHLVRQDYVKVWGAAISYGAVNATTENITLDVTVGTWGQYNNASTYTTKQAGVLYNYIAGGTIKSCTVNVTLPQDLQLGVPDSDASQVSISGISALGRLDGVETSIAECSVTLKNYYNDDNIQLSSGHSADATIEDSVKETQ